MNKSFKLSVFSLLLTLLLGNSLTNAQNVEYYDPYNHVALPAVAPQWMEEIEKNPSGVNFFKMDSLYNDWLNRDWDAKIKTVDKKPAVNYYRRWRKAYLPYVDREGNIVLPTIKSVSDKIDRENRTTRLRSTEQQQPIWRNIGPNRTRSTYLVKDSQACVFRVDASKSDNNIVYVGAETGVVFKTTDKGMTWKACNGSFNFGSLISAIAVDPKNPNTVYVGSDIGLWKSTDGGDNWKRISASTVKTRVNSIRINPDNTENVTIVSEDRQGGAWDTSGFVNGGFCVSNDGGNSFEIKISGYGYDHELKPNDPNKVYVLLREAGKDQSNGGTQLFVYDLKTNTKTAHNILNGYSDRPVKAGRLAVSHAPNGENYLYALVTEDRGYQNPRGEGLAYIMQSKDGGNTWTNHTVRKEKATFRTGATFYGSDEQGGQGYFDMAIAASNKNPEHVMFGLTCLYRSTQGGAGGWARGVSEGTGIGGYVAQDKMHPDIQDICVVGDDTWVVNDGGIQYSNNFFETNGQIRVNGIYASDYHGFSQGWNEDVMAGGRWHNGDAVHARSYGEGNTIHVGGVEKATGYVFLHDPYLVFFSDASAGTYKMPKELDGNVQEMYSTLFTNLVPYEVLRSNGKLAFDPRYAQRFISVLENRGSWSSSNDKLYVSENYGRTFTEMKDTEGDKILDYDFARSNPNVIYMITQFCFYVSQDNGHTWEERTRPFESSTNGHSPVMITIDPMDANTVWATDVYMNSGVKVSKDGGNTWETIDYSGIDGDNRIHWIVLTGDDKNGVYMATTQGARVFYRDSDTNNKWIDYSLGLNPGARITKLLPFYKDGLLRAATNQGIWEANLFNKNFRPVAQPMAINLSTGTVGSGSQVQLDSYSNVRQTDKTKWEWRFSPEPSSIDSKTIRNPKVVFSNNGTYDVTLKITNENGMSHSRTIKKMIVVGADNSNDGILQGTGTDNPNDLNNKVGISSIEKVEMDAIVIPNVIMKGENTKIRTTNIKSDKVLNIYDIKGRKIREIQIAGDSDIADVRISDLQQGVYIYEVSADKFKGFGKILIK